MRKTVEWKKMRLHFAAALLASSNESKGTIKAECP